MLALPAVLAVCIASFALITRQPALERAFVGAGAVLLVWCVALWFSARRAQRRLTITRLVRAQHWLQACAQGTLILYWAYNTPIVRAFLPFILAELVFAYAVDSLLNWSRRDVYAIGFGPFPIVFSISLFMLFKPDWFALQFGLIVLGFAAKEFIRWNREGRSAHIFNPSSFPLAVVSLVLLATGTTDLTFGPVIANTIFDTPHIHFAIFLVALPGMLLFGVSRTSLAAATTLYLIGLIYFATTGTYLFYDAYIPPAVLIGMTLLVTDPSTSPRSDLGRFIFGALYGIATAILFVLLSGAGAPTFYDKLLPVPLLNLTVRGIDRLVSMPSIAALDPGRLMRALSTVQRNVVYATIWGVAFLGLRAVGGVGDVHPGQYLPFWVDACRTGSDRACRYAADLKVVYCERGSGWACNDVGVLRRRVGQPADREFGRACELGFQPGCENAARGGEAPDALASAPPGLADLPILLSGTKPTLEGRDAGALYALACEQGWSDVCAARPGQ